MVSLTELRTRLLSVQDNLVSNEKSDAPYGDLLTLRNTLQDQYNTLSRKFADFGISADEDISILDNPPNIPNNPNTIPTVTPMITEQQKNQIKPIVIGLGLLTTAILLS